MLKNPKQDTRFLSLTTTFGENELVLEKVTGTERFSELFEYELECRAPENNLPAVDIVGHNATFCIKHPDGDVRFFNGFVKRFANSGRDDHSTMYRMTIVPWFWFLTQTSDCRIFQKKNVPTIVEKIFTEAGFHDFDMSGLSKKYPKREYCVQYRESDFAFISRLLEEEGIYYYFRHENGKHVLIIADASSGYIDDGQNRFEAEVPSSTSEIFDKVTNWERQFKFGSGNFSHTDYNFEAPAANLLKHEPSINKIANDHLELFEFPGRFGEGAIGQSLSRIRIEEVEKSFDTVTGEATYHWMTPGRIFSVSNHPQSNEIGRKHVLVGISFEASVRGTYVTADQADEIVMLTKFECIPDSVSFRPDRATPQPIVEGPQTAVVVGPKNEEIYVDKFGRVKCQFHWDRRGKKNEKSSCWIRTSQTHAGNGWGAMDIPRIGEEVIVDFLEGDPDRPIITGRVYNADNPPPFALDENNNAAGKTRRGSTTKTHKGGGYNEMSMDDATGNEQIRMNAQKNMNSNVNNDQTLSVGNNRTDTIGNDDTLKVGNNSTTSVGNDMSVDVANNQTTDAGKKIVMNAGSSITLKCGASKIFMNSGGVINITGTIITTMAAANAAVVAPLTQVVGGAMLTTAGGINMLQGGVTHIGAAGLCSVSGGKVDVVGGTTSVKGAPVKLN